jgi:hypothetical protein
MPVVIFFACLDLDQKSSLMDEHFIVSDSEMAFFVLIGVLSPRRRLYEPEAAGFRLRRTDVRLAANPCAALIRTKTAHF